MGKLLEEAERHRESTKRKTGLEKMCERLDPEDRDDLLALLHDRDVSHTTIQAALRAIDEQVSTSTIGDWRRAL